MTEKNTVLKLNGGFKEITTEKQKLIEKAKKSLENRIKTNKITLFEIKSIIASINDIIKYDFSYTSINDTQSFFKNNGFKVIEKDTFYIIEI